MNEYLTNEQKLELFAIVRDLTGGDYDTYRGALIGGLPSPFKAILQKAPVPAAQLMADLTKFVETDRLADGTVPLAAFLKTLLVVFGADDPTKLSRIRELLDAVAERASGAPAVGPPTANEIKEAIVHQNDMLPLSFMREGLAAAASVCKLEVTPVHGGTSVTTKLHLGTGWLIGPGLLLTNHHVINARLKGQAAASADELVRQVRGMRVLFDHDESEVQPSFVAALELLASDPALDYALISIADTTRAPLPISAGLPEAAPNHGAPALNIIQHPDGDPKQFAIRNNLMASASETDLRYFTDTKGGSSGAPVFDDAWRVVALHRGHSFAPHVQFNGRDAVYMNVGTRISAIVQDLSDRWAGREGAGDVNEIARLLALIAPELQ